MLHNSPTLRESRQPHPRRHQERCQPQHVRHHLHGLERENKGTRAHRSHVLHSRDRRVGPGIARTTELMQRKDITQKRRPGLRAFLRVPKAQATHQPTRRHATSPLPPNLGSSRDGHPRHGSEVGSWEQTSPCCSGQSQQIPVRLSTTQQDRGECGQETSRIAVNIRDTPVSAQRPRHVVHRKGWPTPLQMAQRDDRLWPYRPLKGSRSCREVGGWIHETLVELCKSWPRRWGETCSQSFGCIGQHSTHACQAKPSLLLTIRPRLPHPDGRYLTKPQRRGHGRIA